MNKTTRENLDAYYREAETWAKDRQEELHRSRRIAWIVAAVAAAVALLEAGALILLTPLKTVEPYTLLVDRNTGFVQAVRPLADQRVSGDTALTQSLLVQYVTAREGFDIDSVQQDYRNVTLWSAERARAEYIARMQPSNPESPLARYPRDAVVETQVRSVSPVARNVAMVRFETRLRNTGGQVTPLGAWVALIRYRFNGEPMRQEDRFANPLGFQVVRYRKDQEALPAPEALQPPPGLGQPQAPGPSIAPVIVPGAQPPAQQQRPPQRPPEPEVEL